MLAADPLCAWCQRLGIVRLAKHVDHIVPVARGGAATFANSQGVCPEHHDAKTCQGRGFTAKLRPRSASTGYPDRGRMFKARGYISGTARANSLSLFYRRVPGGRTVNGRS
jgi:hypothetical protein